MRGFGPPELGGTRLDFCPGCVPRVTAFSGEALYTDYQKTTNGGLAMRVFLACAIIISATLGLAGCFGHHEKAVVQEPLKLG